MEIRAMAPQKARRIGGDMPSKKIKSEQFHKDLKALTHQRFKQINLARLLEQDKGTISKWVNSNEPPKTDERLLEIVATLWNIREMIPNEFTGDYVDYFMTFAYEFLYYTDEANRYATQCALYLYQKLAGSEILPFKNDVERIATKHSETSSNLDTTLRALDGLHSALVAKST